MPEKRIAHIAGLREDQVRSDIDFSPCKTAHGHHPKFAGMSEHDMREFMKEEQKEGMHPSLRGKRF